MVPGVGPHTSQALLERFGSAGAGSGGVARGAARRRRRRPQDRRKDLPRLARTSTPPPSWPCAGAWASACIARGDPAYPPPLENIPDPPGLLYVKGAIEPRDQLAIAVVGSRHCTPYGLRIAERLSSALARTGFTVVSGLARGIDAAAHRGAIKAGGRTIGVLANGLASVYPPEHEDLARAVVRGGCPGQRDADAAKSARRLVHAAEPDHLRAVAGRARRRGDPAQRVALDRVARHGTESRGLRRPRPGRQPGQPGLPSLDPRRCPPGRDGRRHPRRARSAGSRGSHRSRGTSRSSSGRAGTLRLGTIAPGPTSTISRPPSTI